MWLLGGLLFVGMGEFNAVATWLESILDHFGRGSAAGYLIAIMTAAGVAGAAVLPQVVAARERRRTLLLAALLMLSAIALGGVPLALRLPATASASMPQPE